MKLAKLAVVVLAIAVALFAVAQVKSKPELFLEGHVPLDGQATIVMGQTSEGPRPVDELALTYPEAAVAAEGAIFIANALGFTVERVSSEVAETVLSGRFEDEHPSIFSDLRASPEGVLALDSSNARVWNIDRKGKASIVFEAPQAPDYVVGDGRVWKTEYLLSSLDARGGEFLTIGARVIWQGGAQQYGVEGNALYVGRGDTLTKVSASEPIVEKYGNLRDAIWLGNGYLVIAGKSLVHFGDEGERAAIDIGATAGGGILQAPEGWLVGAHTDLFLVAPDLSSKSLVPLPFPPANLGHLSWSASGHLLVTDTDGQTVYEVDLDADALVAQYGNNGTALKVVGLATDTENLFLIENAAPRALRYDPTEGGAHVVAGDGVQGYDRPGPSERFSFQYPSGIARAPDGSLYVTEANYRIVQVRNGNVDIFAGGIDAGVPSEGQDRMSARFGSLRGMAIDQEGSLLVVDQTNHSVWKIDAAGAVTKVMGTGQAGQWAPGEPATSQPLNTPTGILVRKDGSILIADSWNHVVVGIDEAGNTFTFAGRMKGTTYQGYGDYEGDGGLATDAKLNTPRQMAEDAVGNVYIVDEFNNAIRRVAPDGMISTFAGGHFGFSPHGTHMNLPQAVAVLGNHLYVADTGNSIVWAFPLE